ncbi:hypothetical protein [Segetibacter koreensis]|uniref:hypothetical protein n=1 Tax=Segetibacter koreensis TaxID=398037 RepID=UPI0003791322|nr:hypothetical protein [Segetibacter koreensis]
MDKELTPEHQFEVIKFLYQFKEDNKFYRIDKNLLSDKSHEEKFRIIYTLRDNALIATDREIYYNHSAKRFLDYSNTSDEIRARILPKGIEVVEASSEK